MDADEKLARGAVQALISQIMRTPATAQFEGVLMPLLELQRTEKGSALTVKLPSQQARQTMNAALNKSGWQQGAGVSSGPALLRNSG
eukprot:692583-Rhodomonas_salina.1